jgi:hypothetical protein
MDRKETYTNINIVKLAIVAIIILMVVFSILAGFLSANSAAADQIRTTNISLIQKFLGQYKIDSGGSYPPAALDKPTGWQKYLSALPVDTLPSGCKLASAYTYNTLNDGASYQLRYCIGSSIKLLGPVN